MKKEKLEKVKVKAKIEKKEKIDLDQDQEVSIKAKEVEVMIKKEAKNHIKTEIIKEKIINMINDLLYNI